MKILFLDSAHPLLKEKLQKSNITCEEDFTSSKTEIEKKISSYDGIILRSRFSIDKRFIDAATNLKFIARVGSGMDHIEMQYAESKGIKCLSSPEGNRNAVAEHALGMLLSLLNNICKANHEVKNGKWQREINRGTELEGKTIGIYGYGNTGSAFVKILGGFDINILIYDKYKKNYLSPSVGERRGGRIKESTPEEIFSEANVLSLHLPLTQETTYLVNESFISKFKKNILLINTSRGPIVKTNDLVKNLKNGKVIGACLDVLEYEETSFEGISSVLSDRASAINENWTYLTESNRVILTPHIAGWSHESAEKMARVLAEKICSLYGKI